MSEENNPQAQNSAQPEKAPTRPLVLAVSVLIAAAIISFFGVNASGLVVDGAGSLTDLESVGAPSALNAGGPLVLPSLESGKFPKLPPGDHDRALLAQRGQQLEKEQCSACHTLTDNFIGPSYEDILKNAGRDKRITPVDLIVLQINPHSGNAWPGYPRGPQFNLSSEDRLALAYWIAQSMPEGGKQN